MRVLLCVLLVSAPLASLAPVASATHDACRLEDLNDEPRCAVGLLLNQHCAYNPLWYVDPGQPQYVC